MGSISIPSSWELVFSRMQYINDSPCLSCSRFQKYEIIESERDGAVFVPTLYRSNASSFDNRKQILARALQWNSKAQPNKSSKPKVPGISSAITCNVGRAYFRKFAGSKLVRQLEFHCSSAGKERRATPSLTQHQLMLQPAPPCLPSNSFTFVNFKTMSNLCLTQHT